MITINQWVLFALILAVLCVSIYIGYCCGMRETKANYDERIHRLYDRIEKLKKANHIGDTIINEYQRDILKYNKQIKAMSDRIERYQIALNLKEDKTK